MSQDNSIMARFDQETHSFIIRLWREHRDQPEEIAIWRGWIEHLPSGQRHYFKDTEGLHDIVFDYLGETLDLAALFTKLGDG